MLKVNILGTGHGMATKCYNTCFTIEEDNKHFLVDFFSIGRHLTES